MQNNAPKAPNDIKQASVKALKATAGQNNHILTQST